ncbi:MAG: panC [Gammaproteobacteria bacterium]|jgi:pantoate--beta-alanine ligase|nr:panC [Gammaproteobacteria bacterium]
MNIVTDIRAWQSIRENCATKKIGFIPTMGYLHAGHASLCERARRENDITVVSIFVNPPQFNQSKDFNLYPRAIEEDIALLTSHRVDYLFLPDEQTMYHDHYEVQVTENALSKELEGAYRPGHFNGVLTIVLKLLNIIQPLHAYFGEKDYQQFMLIKKMVSALFLPLHIIGCETIRAEDGLALSSRNVRLNAMQREKAAHFPKLLHSDLSPAKITEQLQSLGFKVDYIVEQWGRRLGAVWLDEIRLIDNMLLRTIR